MKSLPKHEIPGYKRVVMDAQTVVWIPEKGVRLTTAQAEAIRRQMDWPTLPGSEEESQGRCR